MTARFLQRRIATATAAAALMAALAVPAFAQPAPVAPPPPAGAAAPGAERPHRMPSPEERQARMARHAEALRQKLQLTPAQQPAWDAFTAAMQPQGPRPARLDAQNLDQLTTPERIDRMRALRAQRSAEADRRDEAVKTFYAALNPAQQKVFDQESRRMHGHDGMRGKDGKDGRPGRDGKPGGHGAHGERAPAPPAPPASR
ncbi:Spy/CpxP family protein refolding chaperone [Acidovorax sp. GBBC 3334]|uniref:Spy/CpxP family protein refolding chaperone n=1 Tax=Acidovorax sp. GBBC 3334 TaxID=2940496 RepID=UPI0023024E10|nr:Spy/CpxP family protein refolding chaperone [Acidovorax sp. GBBC 3334]MDA8454951.1 Spy/CpxP family protein refolding chaperone [Acidovorax sp. GBBC 3334]